MVAKLIALEGIDGSGKGTQAARLHARFEEQGLKSELISFPRYTETHFGRAIGDFLNGKYGSLGEVDPHLASLLYAGDRFESRGVLLHAMDENDVVVLDRFVPSNMAHQAAKRKGNEQAELINWIAAVEFGVYALPRPDMVVLLDLPAETAQVLIAKKAARVYTDKPADLQEADALYLENVRQVYRNLAQSDSTWCRIDIMCELEVRSIDEIGDDIWQAVQQQELLRG